MRPRLLFLLTSLLVLVPAAPAAAGEVSTRVVGGTTVAAGDHPWQVAMLTVGGDQICGGTLVDDDWVLTAAHCGMLTTEQVRVGSTSQSTGGQVLQIAEVEDHPLADPDGTPRFDVTMVRLETPESDPVAQPLQLVTPGADDALWAPGELLTVTGWGDTFEGDPNGSSTLREARVPRVGDAGCAESYDAFAAEDMVCAGYAGGGIDTCQGDSGGPMIAPTVEAPSKSNPAHWRLVGATSWGIGCARAGNPGVYARLGDPVLGDWTSTTPLVAATPTLSGGSEVGDTVTCDRGAWTGRAYFTYRFFRRPTSGPPQQVASTTSNDYLLSAGDAGSTVFCRVHGENAVSSVDSGASNETAAVGAQPVPSNTAAPTLTGEPVVGRELRCNAGSWEDAASIAYSFRRIAADGSATTVATVSQTYVPSSNDAGSRIACVERATNPAGSAEATSNLLGPVTAPTGTVTPDPRPDPLGVVVPPGTDPVTGTAPPDLSRPLAALASPVRCRARRCTIVARVSDPAPSAGVAGVRGRIAYRVTRVCRRDGRRRLCSILRTRILTGRRLSARTFAITTPRLPRGRRALRITATDGAQNTQLLPTVVRFRVR